MSKSHSGFTLIEMMITVLVISILVAIGLPSFNAVLRSTKIATQTNTFLASINLARSEAIKNNFNAAICASADGATCTTTWNSGWIVFDDTNNNGTLDAGETVLRVVKASPDLTFVTNPAAGPGTIVFNQRGMFVGALPQIELDMQPISCPSGYQGLRIFKILQVGQATVVKGNCP